MSQWRAFQIAALISLAIASFQVGLADPHNPLHNGWMVAALITASTAIWRLVADPETSAL